MSFRPKGEILCYEGFLDPYVFRNDNSGIARYADKAEKAISPEVNHGRKKNQ
jgi:hypothetical protein